MHLKQSLIALALGLTVASPAMAIVNGNFSQPGLTGWETLGDAAKNFGGAVMTTASATRVDDAPDDAGAFNASGISAAPASGGLATFTGLADNGLDTGSNLAYEGSAIRQTFQVATGDTLSFKWAFYTNEPATGGSPDFAFVVIDGQRINLASAGDASLPSVPFDLTTGAQTFTYTYQHTFQGSGLSTMALGVVDVGNVLNTSALWVDNISLTPGTLAAPVPEPGTWTLMLSGLGLVGFMVSKRSKDVRTRR